MGVLIRVTAHVNILLVLLVLTLLLKIRFQKKKSGKAITI